MELAQRCLAGDVGALREFVEMHQQQVYALCYRMLGHRQDAEDTTQESLLRALKYLSSWDSSQPLTPWVLKIAANRCRTNLGKRAKRSITSQALHDVADDSSPAIGLAEELHRALDLLGQPQRTCFCLFYQEEMRIGEIAKRMNVPEGTVKTWLHRSRKILAQRLRERGVVPSQRQSHIE